MLTTQLIEMAGPEGGVLFPPRTSPFNFKEINKMKKHITAGVVRSLMLLFSCVFALGAYAENSLTIENVTLNSTTPKKVAIMLDNTDPVAGLQFDVLTPEGVNIIGDFERNDARFAPGQTSNYKIHNPQNARLIVISGNRKDFIGDSGVLGYVTVQATQEALENGIEGKISLSNIILSNAQGGKVVANKESQSVVSATNNVVTISTVDPFVINPGGQKVVSFSANANFGVSGLQAEIVLPEGFRILNDEVNKGNVLSNGAAIDVTPRADGRTYGIVVYDFMVDPETGIFTGNSGEIFNFTIVAPEAFTEQTAEIQFRNVEFASLAPKTVYADPVSVIMTNGKPAYDNAVAEIASLRDALADALATIAANSPDVKDLFPGTEISDDIDNLEAAVVSAYEDCSLTPDYDDVMAPAESIRSAIAKLINDAASAQTEYQAAQLRQQKLDEANNTIAEIEKALADARTTIAETCPDVKESFTGADVAAQIEALKTSVKDAFDNKTIVEDYDKVMAPVASINAAIAKLIADAQAAQKVYEDEQAAIKALNDAKANADSKIAELTASLTNTLATISETCPDVKNQFTGETISNQIDVLKVAVQVAFDNKSLATNYEQVMAPVAGIEASIAKLLADAQAAQKAYADAQKALENAKTNADAKVAELTASLNSALAAIAETCPNVKNDFTGEAVTSSINALKNAIEKAYNDKTLASSYEQIMAPVAGIEASIAKLLADAQAAQKAYNEQSALDQARTNANSTISGLEKDLADALAKIATECPDVKQNFTGAEITAKIAVLRNDVNAAYENGTLVAEYEDVMNPASEISAAIEKMISDAQAAQQKFDDDANAEAALQEAYKNAKASVSDLKAALAKALATIAETCPDVKNDFKGESITNSINDLSEAIKDAYEVKTLVADYEKIMAPAASISAAIEKLVIDAQAAQAEFERVQSNREAYEADLALIDELQDALEEAIAKIQMDYPDANYAEDRDKIQAAIKAQKKQADNAFAAVAKAGAYSNTVDVAGIEMMIDDMMENAATSGVDIILEEAISADDMIFTIDGMRLQKVRPGYVNIIVRADGRIQKVFVK